MRRFFSQFRASGLARRSRCHAALVMCLLMASAVVGFTATPAQATTLTYTVTNYDNDGTYGVYLRNAPDINKVTRDSAHFLTYGTKAQLLCYAWGTAVGPYANKIWHDVKVLSGSNTGKVGWISDHWLNTPVSANHPVPGEAACSSAPPSSGPYLNSTQRVRFCISLSVSGCGTVLSGISTPSISKNTGTRMVCWQDGSNYTVGYTTNRWFWVTSGSTQGFVSAAAVSRQSVVPACSTNKPIWAAETAVQRYGETWARTADRALFAAAEWGSPSLVGEWAGDCPKLPYVGWHAAGISIQKYDAITNYRYYRYYYTDGRLIHQGSPPVGAVAFFNVTRSGHEAISLGNGLVVSTQGLDWDGTPNVVRNYTYWGSTNYLGYYLP